VTDLERFFRRLVANLAASDPARLHHPIPLDDIQQSILPYRANRRALHIESSEDYEMVLLRLCAGEGNLVRTEPEAARIRFAEELESPNPDLDVLRKVEHVVISLRSDPLARALGPEPEPDLPYAPPSTPLPAPPIPGLDLPQLETVEAIDQLSDEPAGDAFGGTRLDRESLDAELLDEDPLAEEHAAPSHHCLYCGDRLPTDRPVRFCPHCGQRQMPPECPQCHGEVEPGWRHCVNCGAALAER
jgi:hypothetical protein